MSTYLTRLNAPARLALFGALLALTFAIAFSVGRAADASPPRFGADAGPPATSDAHDNDRPAHSTQQEIGNEHA